MVLDDIKQKIIFQMGTVGTAQGSKNIAMMALKFTGLTVGVGLAIKKLNAMYDSAVKFDRLVKELDTNMGAFNQRTAGLIDTTASLEGAIRLQNAGMKVSEEQMAAIGVAAADMNRTMGDGPEGATTQFNKLIKSLVQGSERGLLPWGIQLDETTDKSKAQIEALGKLTEKYDGVSVVAETMKEKMFALENSLGTVIDAEFNGFLDDMSDAFDSLALSILDNNDALLQYETDLIATEGQLARNFSVMTDLDSVAAAYNETVIESIAAGESNWIIQGRLIMQNEHMSESTLDNARAYIEERDAIMESIAAKKASEAFDAAMIERHRASAAQGSDIDKLREANEAMRQASGQAQLDAAYKTALALVKSGNTGPIDQFDVAGIYQRNFVRVAQSQQIADIVGATGPGVNAADFVQGTRRQSIEGALLDQGTLGSLSGIQTGERFSGAGAAASGAGAAAFNKATAEQELTRIEQEELAKREQMQKEHHENVLAIQQASADAAAGLLGATSGLVDKNTASGFKAYQALAFSENAIATAAGAAGAYFQATKSLPPGIGQAVGIANAAIATGIGIKTGTEILNMRRDSKRQPSKVSGGQFPAGGRDVGGGQGGGNTYNFAFVLSGNTVQKELVRENELAQQSGNKHFQMGQY